MSEKQYPCCEFFVAQAKIYSLADKQGNVFYIGTTNVRMETRLAQHISAAKNDNKYSNRRKNDIIRKLNYEIVCTIIDMMWITAEDKYSLKVGANKLEKQWIKKYTDLGYQLCNGRLPVVKKSTTLGAEFIGKTLTTMAKQNNKDNSWIKIEPISEGNDLIKQVQRK
jgi:hypothetical protein